MSAAADGRTIVQTDNRGRLSLGSKDQPYRLTRMEHGEILLEPVTTYTPAERELLLNDTLRERTQASLSRPDEGVARRRHR